MLSLADVLYLSHILLYTVFESSMDFYQEVNGNIHHPLRGVGVLHTLGWLFHAWLSMLTSSVSKSLT